MRLEPQFFSALELELVRKAQKRKTTWRRYENLHRLAEQKMKPAVNTWLEDMKKTIKAGLSSMKGKTPAKKVQSIADWEGIKKKGRELLKPLLMEALAQGGNSVFEQLPRLKKQARFDPIGVEAVKWASNHSAELVTEITRETMLGIRAFIVEGVEQGKSIPKIAQDLRPLVGLKEKDLMAVSKYHGTLLATRPELTTTRTLDMLDSYARSLHRKRADMIARTETAFALTEGQRQGYAQMGIERLERVEDVNACAEICAPEDGRIYTIEEAEGVLPAHPNCEGTWVAAAGEEPVDAEEIITREYDDMRAYTERSGNEFGGWYDEKGNHMVYKSGEATRVPLSADEWEKLKTATAEKPYSMILVHTHPKSYSLSGPDLQHAAYLKLKDVRAVTKEGVYSMKPKPGVTWPEPQDIIGVWNQKEKANQLIYWALCEQYGSNEKAWAEVVRQINKEIAFKYKLEYKFTRRKG